MLCQLRFNLLHLPCLNPEHKWLHVLSRQSIELWLQHTSPLPPPSSPLPLLTTGVHLSFHCIVNNRVWHLTVTAQLLNQLLIPGLEVDYNCCFFLNLSLEPSNWMPRFFHSCCQACTIHLHLCNGAPYQSYGLVVELVLSGEEDQGSKPRLLL